MRRRPQLGWPWTVENWARWRKGRGYFKPKVRLRKRRGLPLWCRWSTSSLVGWSRGPGLPDLRTPLPDPGVIPQDMAGSATTLKALNQPHRQKRSSNWLKKKKKLKERILQAHEIETSKGLLVSGIFGSKDCCFMFWPRFPLCWILHQTGSPRPRSLHSYINIFSRTI